MLRIVLFYLAVFFSIHAYAGEKCQAEEGAKKATPNLVKLEEIRSQLSKIGKAYKKYFDTNRKRIFPDYSALELNTEDWTYADPETGSKKKILPVIQGLWWTGNSNYPTAITSNPFQGQHYAVFDNGEVRAFHENYIPLIFENFCYSLKADKKQNELILKLGDSDRAIRKQARIEIENRGPSLVPILRGYLNHIEPEIKVTVKDILEGFKVDKLIRHEVYDLENVPDSIVVGLEQYFIVETKNNFLAVKLLKHTRPYKKYKKVENYGAKYEVTAFSKDGKKLKTKTGEVYADPKRRNNSMKYISFEQTYIRWERENKIYFNAHALAISKTAYSDLSEIDTASKKLIWLKKKSKPVLNKGPSIDIIIYPNFYSYQGNKRTLDEMERTLVGVGAAMGKDVLVKIRVHSEAKQKMVDFLIPRMLKHGLINFILEEYKPRAKVETPRPKDGPILTPVNIENINE